MKSFKFVILNWRPIVQVSTVADVLSVGPLGTMVMFA